jgi:hypothetical protein
MRKMLILMLILGAGSIASAMSLQISVNGDANVTPKPITLSPSQTAELDVWTPNGYVEGGPDDYYWALVVLNNYEGTITLDSGRVLIPPAPDASMLLAQADWDEYFPGSLGVYGQVMSYSGNANPGIYFDQIIFHCDSPHDAVVQLWSTLDFGTYNLEDTVTIQQIPEPATMVLLGLGGLLFRKRGK